MANSDAKDKKRYHRVVMVMARNGSQDFFTRVLTTLVRIGLKNDDGTAPPNIIMKYMARMTQRSVQDKGLRTRVGRALQRGMENGLVTIKKGHFKLTRRAGVVADTKGKLWLKIPTLLPPGQQNNTKHDDRIARRKKRAVKPAVHKTTHHNPLRTTHENINRPVQQQQHRQIQTNPLYLSRASCVDRHRTHGCSVCRPARPSRMCRTPSHSNKSPKNGCRAKNGTSGSTSKSGQNNNGNKCVLRSILFVFVKINSCRLKVSVEWNGSMAIEMKTLSRAVDFLLSDDHSVSDWKETCRIISMDQI
uniref:Uncharacterized protein n=1 Tax=Strigamia maritima TaxID=126957 RepID=T1J726_STRMM